MTAAENLLALASELSRSISRKYRVAPEDAVGQILDIWANDAALQEVAAQSQSLEQIKRTRAYKDASKDASKRIYYGLRRYRHDDAAMQAAVTELEALAPRSEAGRAGALMQRIATEHASTAERTDHLDLFWNALLAGIGDARSLIDIGSGVLPILFPFERAPALECYAAADRDPAAVRALTAQARWRGDGRLLAMRWDISQGWAPVLAAADRREFDVALMLKLVPVVARQQPSLLDVLAQVPARRIVATGSRESMVKRKDIQRREAHTLDAFIRDFGFRVTGRFETPDEFGLIAERT